MFGLASGAGRKYRRCWAMASFQPCSQTLQTLLPRYICCSSNEERTQATRSGDWKTLSATRSCSARTGSARDCADCDVLIISAARSDSTPCDKRRSRAESSPALCSARFDGFTRMLSGLSTSRVRHRPLAKVSSVTRCPLRSARATSPSSVVMTPS
eukprot:scaffold18397_cov65-Phaeocystis_antarctica.AAC.5